MPGADESEYPLRPCTHDEFDTRVLSHAANAVSHDYNMELADRAHNHALSSDG